MTRNLCIRFLYRVTAILLIVGVSLLYFPVSDLSAGAVALPQDFAPIVIDLHADTPICCEAYADTNECCTISTCCFSALTPQSCLLIRPIAAVGSTPAYAAPLHSLDYCAFIFEPPKV